MNEDYQYIVNSLMCGHIREYIKGLDLEESVKAEAMSAIKHYKGADMKELADKERELSAGYDFSPLFYIENVIDINEVQKFALRLSFLASGSRRFRRFFSILQENKNLGFPTVELALQIYEASVGRNVKKGEFISRLFERWWDILFWETDEINVLSRSIVLKEYAEGFLFDTDYIYRSGAVSFPDIENTEPLVNGELILKALKITSENESGFIYISADEEDEKEIFVSRFSKYIKKPFICTGMDNTESLKRAVFISVITDGILFIRNTGYSKENLEKTEEILKKFGRDAGFVFLGYRHGTLSGWTIDIKELSWKERKSLWQKYTGDFNIDFDSLSNKYILTESKILKYSEKAKMKAGLENDGIITDNIIYECCYDDSILNFNGKANEIEQAFSWEQLILPEEQKSMLIQACNRFKYRHIVFDRLGYGSIVPYGRGVSMLLEGPPGTGKTMAAQIVAREIGLKLYRADISQIISKYIGETEKNIREIFDTARKNNVILFFDEMDSLFGKRVEAKGANERYINIEASFLLQQMESHDGVTIMATNKMSDIDEAYFRRISYILHFSMPSAELRLEIWKSVFPANIDSEIDFEFLAAKFEISGAAIKNIALSAVFLSVSEKRTCGMEHVLKALKQEMEKRGQVLIRSDFAEYGYML